MFKKLYTKDDAATSSTEHFGDHNSLDDSTNFEYEGIRRSLSLNDIASLLWHDDACRDKETEELSKIKKIKTNPIPKSVIEWSRNKGSRKWPTVPEPFNLTEVKRRPPLSPIHVPVFKARPSPKHILEKPQQLVPVMPRLLTVPVSPKFQYKSPPKASNLAPKSPKPVEKSPRLGPITPEPFSFDKKDEERKRRHEERIKQHLEEERKKARQFKAQPIPGAVKKRMQIATVTCGSAACILENKFNEIKEAKKPRLVPVQPVLRPPQLVNPAPFHLTSEKRAVDRRKFDKMLKDKEEERERLNQQREKEMREMDEIANAEWRSRLVYHPKPVPVNQQPFVPEKSGVPLTVPETPKFVRKMKKH